MNENTYQISYEFRFVNGKIERFDLPLDSKTLVLLWPQAKNLPAWTRLEYKKCSCCTIKKEAATHCPIAANLSNVVSHFESIISHENARVSCKTPERIYLKKTTVVEGLASILGLIMATSKCPVMEIFRPMARFHLPFSTLEETLVRSTSFYLLRQYFRYSSKAAADFTLNLLSEHYKKLQLLNEGLLKRVRALQGKGSDKNALIVFHSLSQILSLEINTRLHSIAPLFSSP